MNPFAPIGLGASLSRGLRRRSPETRGAITRDVRATIEADYCVWQTDAGAHPADASADQVIARLRLVTGAARVIS